jgi:Flp pilus assembly protein protease CpaA
VGSSLAAAWDLKTTEIPDKIPYTMMIIALIIYGFQSIASWDYTPILSSIIVGALFFGFGFVLYYFGQWGGGDAKLLSAIGFLLPHTTALGSLFPGMLLWFPFPVSYLFNMFFVGAVYMMLYAFALAIMNKKILHEFEKDVKASANIIIISSIALFIVLLFLNWFINWRFQFEYDLSVLTRAPLTFELLPLVTNSIIPLILTIGLFLTWKFVRAVENIEFKKRVHVKNLKVGDVLIGSRIWEGLTERELRHMKQSKKRYVWIKEGVRFAPAFPLALLFTVYFGDAILFLIRFLR